MTRPCSTGFGSRSRCRAPASRCCSSRAWVTAGPVGGRRASCSRNACRSSPSTAAASATATRRRGRTRSRSSPGTPSACSTPRMSSARTWSASASAGWSRRSSRCSRRTACARSSSARRRPEAPTAFPMPEVTVALMGSAPQLDPEVAQRRFVVNALSPDPPEELVDEIVAYRAAHPPDPAGWFALAGAGAAHDASARLGEIGVPTLVVHGTEDNVVDVRNADSARGRDRRCEARALEGVGHLLPGSGRAVRRAHRGVRRMSAAHARPLASRLGAAHARACRDRLPRWRGDLRASSTRARTLSPRPARARASPRRPRRDAERQHARPRASSSPARSPA